MKKFLLHFFFATIIFLGITTRATAAATYFAIATGDWKSTSTWSDGHIPTTGEIAIIPAGKTVTYQTTAVASSGEEVWYNPTILVYGTLRFYSTATRALTPYLINPVNLSVFSGGKLVDDTYLNSISLGPSKSFYMYTGSVFQLLGGGLVTEFQASVANNRTTTTLAVPSVLTSPAINPALNPENNLTYSTNPGPPAVAPSVFTDPVENITASTATFKGFLYPNAGTPAITFEYSTSSNFSSNVASVTVTGATAASDASIPASFNVTNLAGGTKYYVRLKAQNSASLVATDADRVKSFTTLFAPPTTQASNVSISNINSTTATLSWTNGNGTSRAVFVKAGSNAFQSPTTNSTYAASTTFQSGGQIGSTGWYCVYNGTGTTVNITGLTAGQTYSAMVVDYNSTAGDEKYSSATGTNNPNTFVTNTPPSIGGAVANQAVNDNATINPFSAITVTDAETSQTQTVTVTISDAAKGSFTTYTSFTLSSGVYTYTGTAANAQTALRAMVFTPTANRVAPGSTENVGFTITVNDGIASTVTNNTSSVTITSVNDAPAIGGTVASQAVTDKTTVSPFSAVTITDADSPAQTLSITITLDAFAKGSFTTLSGFTNTGSSYTYSGTAANAQTAIRGLVFTPAANRVAPGSTETTTFNIAANDGIATTNNNTTTVISTSVNDAPVIGGAVASQAVTDKTTVSPFSAVTITDADSPAQTLSITITLDAFAKGSFTTLSGFTNTGSSYTYSGTAANAQTAIRGLVFTPAANRVAPGSTETTTFNIAANDGITTTNNNTTTVISTSVNDAPVIGGAVASQAVTDKTTVSPFSAVTIADDDIPAQTLSITITLDAFAKGSFTTLSGFTNTGSSYTYSGTAANAQTAIRGLVFTPAANRVAPGSTETTTFNIAANDGITTTNNNTTTVISTSVNDAPVIGGAVASQAVTDKTTVSPFSAVTITDADSPAQTLAITVTLDVFAKGSFTTLSGFTNTGSSYTYSGTAANAQTAIRGLVFTPAANRVAPGSTETTTFNIAANDGITTTNNNTTTVISTSVNDAPVIGGAVASQAVTDKTTVSPFSTVTITDANVTQTQAVTVALDVAAKGSFTTLNGFTNAGNGSYTYSGTAANAQAAIRGLVFTPATGRVTEGNTETTTFTITVNDGIATAVTNNITTVITTGAPLVPEISYGSGVQTYIANAAITATVPTSSNVAALGYGLPVAQSGVVGSYARIVVDGDGNIYSISDPYSNDYGSSITKLPAGGGTAVVSSDSYNLTSIAVDKTGNVYVSANNAIYKMAAGSTTRTLLKNGFSNIVALVTDINDNLYIADNSAGTIVKLNTTTLEKTVVKTNVYDVYDLNYYNGALLYREDNTSQFVSLPLDGSPQTVLIDGGLAGNPFVDAQGYIYGTNESNGKLSRWNSDGTNPQNITSTSIGVISVGADGEGRLYLTTYSNNYYRTITPTGGYFIDKKLPEGLVFNTNTGAISGTPVDVTPATTYKVTVYRNAAKASANITIKVDAPLVSNVATLSSIALSAGNLDAPFVKGKLTYNATIYGNSVTVTPVTTQANATVTVNGVSASTPVPLSSATTTINITVTAQDGIATKTYTVTVFKVHNLTNAGISTFPATVAYSLRKLSSTYTGYAINVRRSSDNTTLDIGFDANGGLDTVALKNFVGSGSGFVSKWYDQSGYGRDMAQASNGNQPRIVNAGVVERLVGRPAVFFNNKYLTTAKAILFEVAATGIGFAKGSEALPGSLISKTGDINGGTRNAPAPFDYTNNAGANVVGSGFTATAMGVALPGIKNSVEAAVHSFSYSPTAMSSYVNGVDANIAVNTATYADTGNGLYMGKRADLVSSGAFWATELVLLNSFLNDTDRKAIENAQISYYNSADVTLASLTTSAGSVSPAVAPGTLAYTLTVPYSTSSVTLTAVPTNASALLNLGSASLGNGVASSAINLAVGSNVATIKVTAQNGTTSQNYTLTITRENQPLATVNSFVPASGAVGTLVNIAGADLQYTSAVTIGGLPAVITSVTNTSVAAMAMPGATTGKILITNLAGTTTSSGDFTVTATPRPLVQQGDKLTDLTTSGAAGQGTAIALSADGNTAIVGGSPYGGYHGAAWIYVRNGSTWTRQGGLLQGNDEQGNSQQGAGVAISADGNTAVVGGLYDNSIKGAAWVYTRNNGVWTQQGPKLSGSNSVNQGYQGLSVALSADGNTLAVGGLRDDNYKGAVWIYTRTNGVWTQLGNKITATGTASGSDFGVCVSLSADGNTLLAGSNSRNGGEGGAYVFTRNGSNWTESPRILPNDGSNPTFFGTYVRITPDGKKAVIGGSDDNGVKGAAWVFTLNNGTWTQQGGKLTGNDAAGTQSRQGQFVAISSDGTFVLVGGTVDDGQKGAVWAYGFDGSNWAQLGAKIRGTGGVENSNQGTVALSSDGTTAMIGGPGDDSSRGAVWPLKPGSTNALLDSVGLSAGTLNPVFSNGTVNYTISLPADSTSLKLTPYQAEATATIGLRVGGGNYAATPTNAASVAVPLQVGDNTLYIKSTAQDRTTTKTFRISVNRASPLEIRSVTMIPSVPVVTSVSSPEFTSVVEGSSATPIRIKVSLMSKRSTLKINGAAVDASGVSDYITVNGIGLTDIAIEVRSEEGQSKAYTLRISRVPSTNASLNNLSLSLGTLTKVNDTEYTALVSGLTTEKLTQRVIAADGAAVIKVNGNTVASGVNSDFILLTANPTIITTEVTAEDGNTKKTYTVTVTKAASTNTDLKSLYLSPGTLTKVSETAYTLLVSGRTVNKVLQKAVTADIGASLKLNGTTVASGVNSDYITLNAIDPTVITTEVTAEDGTKKTYTVTVSHAPSANADLRSLAISPGTLTKVSDTEYTAVVSGLTNTRIRQSAVPVEAGATIKINGTTVASGVNSDYITLNPTGSTVITTEVTAEDGTKKTYTVTVTRAPSSNANLGNVALSIGTVTKVSDTEYTAQVSGLTTSRLMQKAIVADAGAIIKVNGTTVASGVNSDYITLNATGTTVITTVVIAEDGTTKTYTLTVSKTPSTNANLSSLLVSAGTLTKVNDTEYTLQINGLSTTRLTQRAITTDAGASIKVNGSTVASGANTDFITLNATNPTVITTEVTAEDASTKKTYTVTITRTASTNANLNLVSLSLGTLTKVNDTEYTAQVSGLTTDKLTQRVNAADAGASIKVNGTTVASGANSDNILLTLNPTVITTEVTAEDNSTKKTYTVTVTKTASANTDLKSMYLTPGTLTKVSETAYTLQVTGLTTTKVIQKAVTTDAGASIKVNGTTVASGANSDYITLNATDPTVITTEVTAEDGTKKTYTVTVSRTPSANADLRSIAISAGVLTKVSETEYTAQITGLTTIKIKQSAVTVEAGARLTINGVATASGVNSDFITLNTNTPTVITTVVTAEDGTTKTYTLTISRASSSNANLSSVAVSTGVLTKVSDTEYTAQVSGLTTSRLMQKAIVADAGAIIKVNGTTVASGVNTDYITLNATGATVITTVVTAEDGTTKTYTLTVSKIASTNASLSGLSVSTGTLTKISDTEYTVQISGLTTTRLTQKAITADAGASIKVNGSTVASGANTDYITLNATNPTVVTTEVTAEDASTKKTYTVTITRTASTNANLNLISLSLGTLTKVSDTEYTAQVSGLTTDKLTQRVNAADAGATIRVNGNVVASGANSDNILLARNPTIITTEITAEDNSTKKTYTVTVTKTASANTDLKSLYLTPGTLTKVSETAYTLQVTGLTTTKVIQKAVTADAGASMKVNGTTVASGANSDFITLNGAEPTVITTVVTSEDGAATKTYTVTVTNSSLSAGRQSLTTKPVTSTAVQTVVAPEEKPALTLKPHQALSPNGDGISEYFEIEGIESYPDNTVTILTRNGVKVYETRNYDNHSRVFDGHANVGNSKQQPAGTYFYIIDYKDKGQTVRKTGFLVIKY